jgi:phage head maturation protease
VRIQLARPLTDAEPDDRPVDIEEKSAAASLAGTQLLEADDATGKVTAIVGVTGIVDHVKDLIKPRAYAKTLQKRRPKVCFNHSWADPIGRVAAIEEWLPGDPRLAGLTLKGQPWPTEAGALVATMQFNVKSQRARDAYETVVFFSESDECEWSIGWNPVQGKAVKRPDGTRVISEVDLFEVSPVLFGAAPLTRTLSLKDAHELMTERKTISGRSEAQELATETKAVTTEPVEDDDRKHNADELHKLGLEGLDWDAIEALAETVASDGPESKALEELEAKAHTVKTGGDDEAYPIDNVSDLKKAIQAYGRAKPGDQAKVKAHIMSRAKALGAESELPDDWKTSKKTLADLTADDLLSGTFDLANLPEIKVLSAEEMAEVKVAGVGLNPVANRANAEQLIQWYEHGEGAAKIRWGQKGDWARCTRIAAKYMTPGQAKGFCNLRHHGALGYYPATHAAMDKHSKKSAAEIAAEQLADTWNPLLEIGSEAAALEPAEVKALDPSILPGSMEERRALVQQKLEPLLRAMHSPDENDVAEGSSGAAVPSSCWVSIVATFPDSVIATVHAYPRDGAEVNQTYEVGYTLDDNGDATIGDLEPVQLRMVVDTGDGDGADSEGADDLDFSDILPLASLLGLATSGVKSLIASAPETKAGRVLSGSNESRLRGAVEHLIAVLKAAGVQISSVDQAEGAVRAAEAAEERDTTAPGTPAAAAAMAAGATKTLEPEESAVKTLPKNEVDDLLAGILA